MTSTEMTPRLRRGLHRGLLRGLLTAALATLTALGAGSCGGDPPPDGFELRLRFLSLDPVALDSVRLTFSPADPQTFMMIEPVSYEGGAIDLRVESDGVLVMVIAGSHIADFAVDQGDGSHIFTLELFSDDTVMRSPTPGVRVVGIRAGEPIAEGVKFLPQWPLQRGGSDLIPVPCTADPSRCRT